MGGLFARGVIPSRLFVNLKYAQGYALVGSSGLAGRTFSLNCPYDPDVTGVGAQPVYFDQLAAMYTRYRVVRAHWRIKMVSKTANNAGSMAAAPTPGVNDASFASVEEMAEEPGGQLKEFGGAGSPPATLSGSVVMTEVYGNHPSAVHVLGEYASVSGSRPSNEVYLVVCCNTSGSTDTTQLMVEIVYETWWERRIMADLSARRRVPGIIDAQSVPQLFDACVDMAPTCTVTAGSRLAPSLGPALQRPVSIAREQQQLAPVKRESYVMSAGVDRRP